MERALGEIYLFFRKYRYILNDTIEAQNWKYQFKMLKLHMLQCYFF